MVIGKTGRNFAAGMSGGIAYVLDLEGDFARRCNRQMVDLSGLEDSADVQLVGNLIDRHVTFTSSSYGAGILSKWRPMRARFVKVMPKDFKRVLAAEARARAEGREATFQELVGVGG